MAQVTVYKGNAVEHNGVRYEAGEVITDITAAEAKALVAAGVVRDDNVTETPQQPTTEEVSQDTTTV